MERSEQVLNDYNDFATKKEQYGWKDHIWVVWALHQEGDEAEIHIVTNRSNMVVHWGVYFEGSTDWNTPPLPYPEASMATDDRSLDTHCLEDDILHGKGICSAQIKLFNLSNYQKKLGGIKFVLRHNDQWYHKGDKADFIIPF